MRQFLKKRFTTPHSKPLGDRPWYPLFTWLLVVTLGGILGSLGGLLLGKLLYRLSYDYIVIPQEHQDWGQRFGIFVGTVLAAVQYLGRRSPLPLKNILLGLFSVGVITGISIGCGGLIAHFLYQQSLWQPVEWKLPNPSRYAILVGAIIGRNWGAGLGLILTVLTIRYIPWSMATKNGDLD